MCEAAPAKEVVAVAATYSEAALERILEPMRRRYRRKARRHRRKQKNKQQKNNGKKSGKIPAALDDHYLVRSMPARLFDIPEVNETRTTDGGIRRSFIHARTAGPDIH